MLLLIMRYACEKVVKYEENKLYVSMFIHNKNLDYKYLHDDLEFSFKSYNFKEYFFLYLNEGSKFIFSNLILV